jgi:hypothetical protein
VPTTRRYVIEVLAATFELTPGEVVARAVVVLTWSYSTHELLAAMQERHYWDPRRAAGLP